MNNMNPQSRHSNSFGLLLKRTKSGDLAKEVKKAQITMQAEPLHQRFAAPRYPPKLPEVASNSELLPYTFVPELHASKEAMYSQPGEGFYGHQKPMELVSAFSKLPEAANRGLDPRDRTESMTNRGRSSYASSGLSAINGPRRVRRRKDPTPFNVLVLGSRNAGKTCFLEFLKTALALPPKKTLKKFEEESTRTAPPAWGHFIPHYLETEIDGERVGLTLWDSEGLEKNIANLQLREVCAFLDSKFEETFAAEMKVVRSPFIKDTHIHATLLVLDPSRLDRNIAAAKRSAANGGFKANDHAQQVLGVFDEDVDIQVLQALQRKTTVIPVISKADTITVTHMEFLKKTVWAAIKALNLDPLEGLGLEEEDSESDYGRDDGDEDDEYVSGGRHLGNYHVRKPLSPPTTPSRNGKLSGNSLRRHKAQEEKGEKGEETPFFPLSIISPDQHEPDVIGRKFAWGFADPYNEEHCDFVRLKEAVFTEWRAELREASREQWYEGWRTNRLNRQMPRQ